MKQRINYVDIAKALGMFAVYFLHYGPQGGYGFAFAFYCVPLFFFVSGWADGMVGEMKTREYLLKKVRRILAPYFIFAALSIGLHILKINTVEYAKIWGVQVIKGCIRNTFFAGTMWFLSCLFVISIIFAFVRRIRSGAGIIIISIFFYLVAAVVLPDRPAYRPSWIWNIDSAMEYIIYYALGYVFSPIIMKIIDSGRKKDNIIKGGMTLAALLYSAAAFLGHDLLGFLLENKIGMVFHDMFANILVILAWLAISYILQDIKVLQEIGKNTLFLCGSEWMIKEGADAFFSLFGIEVLFVTPLSLYIFSFVLMVFGVKYVVPIEKKILKRLRIS